MGTLRAASPPLSRAVSPAPKLIPPAGQGFPKVKPSECAYSAAFLLSTGTNPGNRPTGCA